MNNSHFRDNAIIVKTIWEVVREYPSKSLSEQVPIYSSQMRSHAEHNLDQRNDRLTPIEGWSNSIQIDENSLDRDCRENHPDGHFPKSCFSLIDLQKDDPTAITDPQDAHLAKNIIANRIGLKPSQGSRYLALVGVNVMEFQKEAFPHWLWSSFWWTTDPPAPRFMQPQWSHFDACAINAPRQTNVPNDPATNCFNPYLEGLSNDNGLVSNCLSCHRYAAFSAKWNPDTQHSAGVCFGELPGTGVPVSNNACSGNPVTLGDYMNQSSKTAFLWSLADIKPLPASQPAQRARPTAAVSHNQIRH